MEYEHPFKPQPAEDISEISSDGISLGQIHGMRVITTTPGPRNELYDAMVQANQAIQESAGIPRRMMGNHAEFYMDEMAWVSYSQSDEAAEAAWRERNRPTQEAMTRRAEQYRQNQAAQRYLGQQHQILQRYDPMRRQRR